jgi:hypothetical protein
MAIDHFTMYTVYKVFYVYYFKAGQIIIFVIHTPIIGESKLSKQSLHEIDKVNKLIKKLLICFQIICQFHYSLFR